MGCGSSRTIASTLTWETDLIGGRIRKRQGHPSHYRMDGYELGIRVRAKGNFQALYVGTSKGSNEKVSIKESITKNYPQTLAIEEIMILARLNHPNTIQLKEVFVTEHQIYSVLSYIDPMRLKNFVDVKNRTTNLTISDSKYIIRCINDALIHCHENKIIVRGLTPDNILVKKLSTNEEHSHNKGQPNYEVQLVEFGLATNNVYNSKGGLRHLSDHPLFEWNDVLYMPPEAILGHPYSTSVDMWSLGIIMFLMLSGDLPFSSPDDKLLVNAIKVRESRLKVHNIPLLDCYIVLFVCLFFSVPLFPSIQILSGEPFPTEQSIS
jgi:serine/threonine protein kinase